MTHYPDMAGKVAIVTGGSKGIGAAVARRMAATGVKVVINYSRDDSAAKRVRDLIALDGGTALTVRGDMATAADVARLFTVAADAFGPPDILVNNVGIFTLGPLETMTEADFHRHFGTNVLGLMLACQEAAARFDDAGGSIINISSSFSTSGTAGAALYSATKGAIDALTRALAVELGPRRIRVNTVAPGFTHTEGVDALGVIGSAFEADVIAATPLGRIGQPDDIADVILFLASDAARWVTGERILAAGGKH